MFRLQKSKHDDEMQESISFSLKFIHVITFDFKGVPMAKAKCKTEKLHFGFCNSHPESRPGRRISQSRNALYHDKFCTSLSWYRWGKRRL